MTSAMNSWPIANGPGSGASPRTIAVSRSQLEATIGRTIASSALSSSGSAVSRHSSLPGSMKMSSRINPSIIAPGYGQLEIEHFDVRSHAARAGVDVQNRSSLHDLVARPRSRGAAGEPKAVQLEIHREDS